MMHSPAPAPDTPIRPHATYLCTHCHSTSLDIHSVPTFCFRCRDCGGGTPIDLKCRLCSGRTRIREERPEYHAICLACGQDELFFVEQAD
ncbi:MAG: hypothetical protein MK085_10305 [Phycisphaerales bacterium]|nr:hypothetical protein [Phycisphaerales bacterium]